MRRESHSPSSSTGLVPGTMSPQTRNPKAAQLTRKTLNQIPIWRCGHGSTLCIDFAMAAWHGYVQPALMLHRQNHLHHCDCSKLSCAVLHTSFAATQQCSCVYCMVAAADTLICILHLPLSTLPSPEALLTMMLLCCTHKTIQAQQVGTIVTQCEVSHAYGCACWQTCRLSDGADRCLSVVGRFGAT